MTSPNSVPPEVAELLRKGDKIGAMKLLLQAKGGSLGNAKMMVETHDSSGHVTRSNVTLTPEVLAALKSGNKIEAIKLLRTATGIGLVEAKGAIESHEGAAATAQSVPAGSAAASARRAQGLSPGQVPHSAGGLQAVLAIVVIAVAAGLYFLFK